MDFKERYQFDVKTDLIGKGGFSKVYKAFDVVRKRQVALKFFYGDWSEKYDVIAEIDKVDDLMHNNLVRYYDADIIKSVNAIGEDEQIQVGILEYVNGGDITQLLQTKNKALLKSVIKQILEGLKYLHDNGIAHRDLKPKNILLAKDEKGDITVKIADFGISKRLGFDDNQGSTQLLGSVEYMAPEQFNPSKYGIQGNLGYNVDLWSLGIIIYELFTRNTPFGNRSTGLTNEEILNNILFSDIVIDFTKLEQPYQTIVRKCLIKKADDRIKSADELLAILENTDLELAEKKVQKTFEADNNSATMVLPNPKNLILEHEQKLKEEKAKQLAKAQKQAELLEKKANKITQLNNESYTDTNATQVLDKTVVKQKIQKPTKVELPNQIDVKTTAEKIKKPMPATKGVPLQKVNINYATLYNPQEVEVGKDFFKHKNYVSSFKYLSKYIKLPQLDTEAKFYLGYMLYNGKCGGAHDPIMGKQLMDIAKKENRSLVLDLMVKYVLND